MGSSKFQNQEPDSESKESTRAAPLPSRRGKTTRRKDIKGNPMVYTVEDEMVFEANSNPQKAFALHKLKHHDGRVEFRICYYMIAHRARMKGKWAFGQFAPMMTKEELREIFNKLKAKRSKEVKK